MHTQSLLLVASAISGALAAPAFSIGSSSSAPTQPTSALSAPTADLALKQVLLGIGHQNYTCTSAGTFSALGATASLFDIKDALARFPFLGPSISGAALQMSPDLQKNDYPADPADRSGDARDFARLANVPAPVASLVRHLGVHFFTAPDKLPLFDISGAQPAPQRLVGKLAQNTPAPTGAPAGPGGAGAVDWLLLNEDGSGRSFGGVSRAYRIETAGGKPPASCGSVKVGGTVRVPYAAQYWFYGPK